MAAGNFYNQNVSKIYPVLMAYADIKINYKLLREQKQMLLNMGENFEGIVCLIDAIQDAAVEVEGMDEVEVFGRPKTFNVMYNVGKSKYIVNYHDGEKTHSDGSPFYDISILNSKAGLKDVIASLMKQGYREEIN